MITLAMPVAAADPQAPEPATGFTAKKVVNGQRQMVTTANPYASEAARQILRKGGSALDAVIAAQLTLNVVEPQSSGIGGGAFMLYYDAKTRKVHVYDGRETAPAAAREERFLGEDGKPREFKDIVRGGMAVATPGLPMLMWQTHQLHGKLPWAQLFGPATQIAERGFPISERLYNVAKSVPYLSQFPETRALYFHEDGSLKRAGEILVNPGLAATFRSMAAHGVEDFYRGETAKKIIETVQNAPINPGDLTLDDLAHYAVKERPLLCRPYHGYTVCGMTPPSSGGITMLQALGMLEHHDLTGVQPQSVQAVHLISQATMLAFADRDRYIADPDFVNVQTEALLDPAYLAERAKLISWGNVVAKPEAGMPPGMRDPSECPGIRHAEVPNTTHMSIIDAEGNAVAMTSSVEYAFGSGMVANGFVLNNHMTDFAASPVDARGCKAVNRIEPNKRPRSSMSPTLVFDKAGNLVMTVGSPGGPRIIPYVLQTVIAVIDWKMGIQDAMNLPHFTNLTGKTELEEGTDIARLKPALEKLGHTVVVREMNSGLHGVTIASGKTRKLQGGADPRREGVALAD